MDSTLKTNFSLSEEQLNELTPWLISVWQTGSGSLPWITNAHDVDIVFYVKHNHTSPEVQRFKQLAAQYKPAGTCWIIETVPDRKYLYGYEYHFLKNIWGTEKPKWDIFEPTMQARTKQFLKTWVGRKLPRSSKLWYHVLTQVYLFKNGDYFLTDEQAANVRLCHDRKMTEELYDFVVKEVTAWPSNTRYALSTTAEDN